MSEMIAGGACQAIHGSRKKLETDSSCVLHVGEQRLLVFLALDVGLAGRAQVLARARQRQRLLAVEVVRARAQAQREAAVGRAAVEVGDDAAAGVRDPAHRFDQLREVFEVDFHQVVDGYAEPVLDDRDRQRRSAELVGGVDLLQAVAGDFDDCVARDRQARRMPAAGADEHDRVRAAEAGGFCPRFLAVLLASVRAQHEDVVDRCQRVAGRVEHAGDVRRQGGALEVRADEEQDERQHQPAEDEREQAEQDALGGHPAAPAGAGTGTARSAAPISAPAGGRLRQSSRLPQALVPAA